MDENKQIKFKLYNRVVKAVRITRKNFKLLRETVDLGDGCLNEEYMSPEEFYGDYYMIECDGGHIISKNIFESEYKEIKNKRKAKHDRDS